MLETANLGSSRALQKLEARTGKTQPSAETGRTGKDGGRGTMTKAGTWSEQASYSKRGGEATKFQQHLVGYIEAA